jgi:hypothetical protein
MPHFFRAEVFESWCTFFHLKIQNKVVLRVISEDKEGFTVVGASPDKFLQHWHPGMWYLSNHGSCIHVEGNTGTETSAHR